ncbi:MAG TPA: glycosyltransferase family 87 protein [Candidatus Binataceae bacterium]|nr:glycosyltransferase family 87 protein [Candidatus Binataceae bacterium]
MAGRYAARRRNMNGVDSIQIAAAGAPQAWVSGAGLGATLRRPSMIAILWAAALVHVGLTAAELPARAGRFDFSIYYASALALRQNLNPYRINLARIGAPLGLETAPIEHATDPPAFLVCFEPLTLLPVRAAYWVWIALNLAALLAALRLLLGAPSGIDSRLGLALGALALLYPPVGDHFFWAQNKLLVLLLLVLMARWMQQRRDAAAGLTLAVAGLWRGFPFILVGYLVLGRRWRALGFAMAGTAAGAVVTVAIAGVPASVGFLSMGLREATLQRFMAEPINLALSAFVSQILWYGALALNLTAGTGFEALRLCAIGLAELGLLAATVGATARRAAEGDPELGAFDLWVVASVMLAPTAWVHYFVLMLLPFAGMVAAAQRRSASGRALWMAAGSYLMIAASMDLRGRFGPHSTSAIFIAAAEGGFVSLAMAYASVYWFMSDDQRPAHL